MSCEAKAWVYMAASFFTVTGRQASHVLGRSSSGYLFKSTVVRSEEVSKNNLFQLVFKHSHSLPKLGQQQVLCSVFGLCELPEVHGTLPRGFIWLNLQTELLYPEISMCSSASHQPVALSPDLRRPTMQAGPQVHKTPQPSALGALSEELNKTVFPLVLLRSLLGSSLYPVRVLTLDSGSIFGIQCYGLVKANKVMLWSAVLAIIAPSGLEVGLLIRICWNSVCILPLSCGHRWYHPVALRREEE